MNVRARSLLLFCLSALFALGFASASEASVTLKARYDGVTATITEGESYVLYGKFKHRLWNDTDNTWGELEADATPILWRVMELKDVTPGEPGAILLSHYLLESMAYHGNIVRVPPFTDEYSNCFRNDGSGIIANHWDGSELHAWLNSAAPVRVKLGTAGGEYGPARPGFLSSFPASELRLLENYPYNRCGEGEVAPALAKVVVPSGSFERRIDGYYDLYELGTWFESKENPASNNARKAHFKGGPSSFTAEDGDGWYYWTRIPSSVGSNLARGMFPSGVGINCFVYDSFIAVRPALFLNLGPVIFKSASDDFDLGAPATPSTGGQKSNPWILVLDGMAPADKAPSGAVIDATGKVMTVSWNAAISPAVRRWPAPADFTMTRGGAIKSNPVSVTSSDADDKVLILTFSTAAPKDEPVTLGYNLNTDAICFETTAGASATKKIVDSFSNLSVTNATLIGVTLNKTTLSLRSGATFQLTATVYPDSAANKRVAWASDNTTIATVDATGKVTAAALGTAAITATTEDGGKTATCLVTVIGDALVIDLSDLGLVNGVLEIAPGETIDLWLETDPVGATFAATGLPHGLTLTSDGHLTGTVPRVGVYTVKVAATLNGESVSETFTIEVTEQGVKGSSSRGGCDAGAFGGLAVLAALALTMKRRR